MNRTMMVIAAILVLAIAPCLGARDDMKAVTPVAAVKTAPAAVDQVTIPQLLNYQGKLTDTAGHPVPNGLYAVTFSMYAESAGGAAFWTELQNVQTRTGLFSVLLGAVTPMTYVPWDGNCWLEMQVHPDPVMTPRVRIVSAAYSFFSAVAETAMAAGRAAPIRPLVPGVSNAEIANNAVTTDKIQDHTIKGVDLAMPCSLISQVGNPGAALWIKSQNTGNGIRIDSAANNGLVVYYANSTGVLVDSSAGNGMNIYAAATDGIYVAKAHVRGLRVDQAGSYGVAAYGNQGGGYFVADSVIGIGVVARSFNGVAADTAIRAYGKGLASGGWVTGFDDGSGAPCVVASEPTILATGNATVVNGFATIRYPDVFARHIRTDVPVRISLTPRGNPAGMLCVSSTDAAGFRVALKTVPGWDGESNVTFDWLAFGSLPEPSTTPSPEPAFEGIPERGARHD
jgi:hypothetical protein